MMQTYFNMKKTKRRLRKCSKRLGLEIVVRADVGLLLFLKRRCDKCKEAMRNIDVCNVHLKSLRFYLKRLSNEPCLKLFRLLPNE